MPKASMDEDDLSTASEYNIGTAGQFFAVEPVSITKFVQHAAYDQFRRRILTPDPAHVLASLVGRKSIHGVKTARIQSVGALTDCSRINCT